MRTNKRYRWLIRVIYRTGEGHPCTHWQAVSQRYHAHAVCIAEKHGKDLERPTQTIAKCSEQVQMQAILFREAQDAANCLCRLSGHPPRFPSSRRIPQLASCKHIHGETSDSAPGLQLREAAFAGGESGGSPQRSQGMLHFLIVDVCVAHGRRQVRVP